MTNSNRAAGYMSSATNVELDPYGVDWYSMGVEEKQTYLNRWRTPHTDIHETSRFVMKCFSKGDVTKDAVIIFSPQSGHTSVLCDYDKDQSLVQCAIDNSNGAGVYALDYKSYDKSQGTESYNDLVLQMVDAIAQTPTGKAHLIGLCQAALPAAVVAATRPELVASLTVAGAPIDTKGCPSILDDAIKMPMEMYDMMMIDEGVVSGKKMLNAWMSSNPVRHRIQRWYPENLQSYKASRFAAWYYEDAVQDLSGGWYREAIEFIFKNNDLYEGRMVLGGQIVNFENITCKVNSVWGTRDDISPREQALGLLTKVKNHTTYEAVNAGHISIFMGTKALVNVWPELFSNTCK
jgi:poly(3-hydroxyalkanoate) synthetase